MIRFAALITVLVAALAATGCGSSNNSKTTSTQTTATSSTGQGSSTKPAGTASPSNPTGGSVTTGKKAPAGGVSVTMQNTSYIPKNITVHVGQKITWVNKDPIPHTATATAGAKFDSGVMQPGAKYSFTPTKPGTIAYWCTIHRQVQTGTITVIK
jgi:plastocyanin